MALELTKKVKTGLILVVGTGLGLYFGCLVGAALIASAMNPVGAGFLALLLTAMMILALVGTLWALFGREAKGGSQLPELPIYPYEKGDPNEHRPPNALYHSRNPIRKIGQDPQDSSDPDEEAEPEDWMVVHGAYNREI